MRNIFIVLVLFLIAGCKRENIVKECCAPIPLHVQFGPVPKMYNTVTVLPESSPEISADVLARWQEAKAAVLEIAGGPRTLRYFDIKFLTETQLTVTYYYTVASGAEAVAVITYNYLYDDRGYLKISYAARTANGRLLAPALFPFQEDFLERYAFRIDWVEDKIPGSTGHVAAFYTEGEEDSFFTGDINK